MNSAVILVALTALGVDVGWQEIEDGSIEYIIQIEPQLVESLKDGHDLTSGIRPELRHIRRYRIVIGSKKLPQNPPLEELQRRWAAEKAAAAKNEEPRTEPKGEPARDLKKSDVPPAFQVPPPPFDFPSEPLGKNPFGTPEETDPTDDKQEPTAADPKDDEPTEKPSLNDDASNPPSTFKPDDTQKPLVEHVAAYGEADQATNGSEPESTTAIEQDTAGAAPARPWGTLIAVLLGLFASLGLNAFLGWLTIEQRGRYRSLLGRNAGTGVSAG